MKKTILKLAGVLFAAVLAMGMVSCADDGDDSKQEAVWTKGENETITITYPEGSVKPSVDLECVSYSCPLPKGVTVVNGELLADGADPLPVTATAEQECNVELGVIRIKDGKVIIYTFAYLAGTEEDHNMEVKVKLEGLPEKILYFKLPMPM